MLVVNMIAFQEKLIINQAAGDVKMKLNEQSNEYEKKTFFKFYKFDFKLKGNSNA